jgi:uncharacterized protein
MPTTIARIAAELAVREQQVQAAVELLDGGATVPFIARYRKEATGGLDDIALRALESRLVYLRELDDRRLAILRAIEEQGKLSPRSRARFGAATTKQELEDLYLPFKLKRRTKGELAREAGLEALADLLLANPTLVPLEAAAGLRRAAGRGPLPDGGQAPGLLHAAAGARRRAGSAQRALGRPDGAGAGNCASGCGPKAGS